MLLFCPLPRIYIIIKLMKILTEKMSCDFLMQFQINILMIIIQIEDISKYLNLFQKKCHMILGE